MTPGWQRVRFYFPRTDDVPLFIGETITMCIEKFQHRFWIIPHIASGLKVVSNDTASGTII